MNWYKRLPFFYGWIIVAAIFICFTVGYAAYHSFSIFYVAILDDFGWSRASTAAAFSLFSLVYGFTSPLAGGLLDRFGPRVVVPAGAVVLGIGLLLTAQMKEIWQFFLLYGVVVALGLNSMGIVPNFTLIGGWFVKRRGVAWGIAVAGVGVGTFIFAPILQGVINSYGWRTAYVVLACAILLVVPPIYIIFSRHHPRDLGMLPDGNGSRHKPDETPKPAFSADSLIVDREWASRDWSLGSAMRTQRFWFAFGGRFFETACMNTFLTHQAAYLVDLGQDKMLVASVVGLVGLVGSFGKMLWGFVSDWLGREVAYLMVFAAGTAGALLLILAHQVSSPWLLYSYALVYGLCYGASSVIFLCLTGDLFQGKRWGSILGGAYVAGGIGLAVGAFFGGYIFDLFRDYRWAFAVTIPGMWLACALYWLAAPRKVRMVVGRLKSHPKLSRASSG